MKCYSESYVSRHVSRGILVLLALLFALPATAVHGQQVTATFRYVTQPGDEFVRVMLPGQFNNWGQDDNGNYLNSDACIYPDDESLMEQADDGYWFYQIPLQIGSTYQYKVQIQFSEDGTSCAWISDPLNERTNPSDNNNSVVTITDPMVFQLARELNEDGLIEAVSASVFGSEEVASLTFEVNGAAQDGMAYYNPDTGVFRYVLQNPIKAGSQFGITVEDVSGATASDEIGVIQPPVTWVTPDFTTFIDHVTVHGSVTRQDGTVDPDLTEATIVVDGQQQAVAVDDGAVSAMVALDLGENAVVLQATVDGTVFTSSPLVVTRRQHPLDDPPAVADVSTTGADFSITIQPQAPLTAGDLSVDWRFDEDASTATLGSALSYGLDGLSVSSTVATPGELYLDADVTAADGRTYFQRVALVVEDDGTVRQMAYDETPAWVDKAVVYEIFPFSFGPTGASGTASRPGNRLNEITAELDYLAGMGFNVVWFMPIMRNQFLDQLSGGYNIVDFENVDPKLGTNEDFKALVERAHALGIKVILDITPNHVSPVHPWVESLREMGEDSPFFPYIQTTPNPHDDGLDGRGPNLPETWQVEGGRNLYRKYQGFGDLANLNWDDDGLQAAFLDVIRYWVEDYDIDGWRFDVYWGPWRRYGPDRFGTPIRELMKRIKPDSWILGEIAGTGQSTEVYYADDDNGTPVVGGIDAGYDWNFYHDAIRGTYGSLGTYDQRIHNGDFWPGPHARYFRFLENHDETRIAKVWRTVPDRILPLTGMLLTTTGIPMVYQGQEVGFGDVSGDERRRPVSWQTEENGRFAETYQRLSLARTHFPAFWTQDVSTLSTSNGVYAYVRPYLDQNAVVLVNFDDAPSTVSVDPTASLLTTTDGPVTYTDLFADSTFTDAALDGFDVTVPPYQTVVFVTGDVTFDLPDLPDLPFGAVYTGTEDAAAEVPATYALDQNYPNPFNPSTNIGYRLPRAGRVRLAVFDVLGRRVALLVDARQAAGTYTVTFDAANLPSGTYFYRLSTAEKTMVGSMVLMR